MDIRGEAVLEAATIRLDKDQEKVVRVKVALLKLNDPATKAVEAVAGVTLSKQADDNGTRVTFPVRYGEAGAVVIFGSMGTAKEMVATNVRNVRAKFDVKEGKLSLRFDMADSDALAKLYRKLIGNALPFAIGSRQLDLGLSSEKSAKAKSKAQPTAKGKK